MTASSGSRRGGFAVPFLLGGALGAVGGAVVGIALSGHATQLIAAVIHAVDRRGVDRDRDRMPFELLLQ